MVTYTIMDEKVLELAHYMKDFGMSLLGHALEHAVLLSVGNQYWNAFGVLHTAQAAEIIIKACIAMEQPLLIFPKLPALNPEERLSIEILLRKGRTLSYSELPAILQATTGYSLSDVGIFMDFGHLRNTIQHLYIPENRNLPKETLLFVCKVLDPLFQHFWQIGVFEGLITDDTSVIDFIEVRLREYDIPYDGWLPDERYAIREIERHGESMRKLHKK